MTLVILLGLVASNFVPIRGGDKLVGPGKWTVINIMKCDKDASMLFKLDISRHKINRTHDGFDAKMKIDEPIDDTHAIHVDICKMVDGGCKPYQVLADHSFANFCKKYSPDNVEQVLTQAGVDPPDFPIGKGVYELHSYLFNYDDLPDEGIYGQFVAVANIIKDGLEKGCVSIHVRFDEKAEQDEEEEER